MPSRLAVLLLLAAALGVAHAARELSAPGRQLLQSPNATDCDRSVRHCVACRYQFYRGTVTKAICTKCDVGYAVKNSGRACYCAPGYYSSDPSLLSATPPSGQTGFQCDNCTFGYWCPGAKITITSSTVRTRCGNNKKTTTEYAKSDRECVTEPGHGWEAVDAVPCEQGFYNPGYNTRKCTKCPGDLTTTGKWSNSTQDCQAPEGYYYLRGKAVACARGTFKTFIGNQDCTECPTGTTTALAAVGKKDAADCTVLLPGYQFASGNVVIGTGDTLGTNATECPQDYFRIGEATIVGETSGTPDPANKCKPCGTNMVTLANVTKATSPDACLVAPGYGWAPGGSDGQGTATICGLAKYNPGYNREPCVKCGNGTINTDQQGSISADQCYTPEGHGNRRDPISGVLEGYACPANTYGRFNKTYGLVDVECTKCLENSHTNQGTSTNASQCVTDAGYGYDNGAVNQCPYGTYSAGDTHDPCTLCGDGFNTTSSTSPAATATDGYLGATVASQCKADFGYQLIPGSNILEPCLRGWYKGVIGNTTCSQCPAGMSTMVTMAAVDQKDCDVCRPGFGTNSGINGGVLNAAALASLVAWDGASAGTCQICPSGKYSPGFLEGVDQSCVACPKTQNFTGNMVSRRGSWTPEDCFGEFITNADNEQNFLPWDYIYHNISETTSLVLQATGSLLTTCQNGCRDDHLCQYMVFYKSGAPDGANACYFRKAGTIDTVSNKIHGNDTAVWWNDPDVNLVLFEIKEGAYVVYPKVLGEKIGIDIDTAAAGSVWQTLGGAAFTAGNFKDMKKRCDADSTCIGMTHDVHGTWRPFKGSLMEDVIGKVRVVGTAINSWISEPTGLEDPEGWTPTA